jgi:hypothetical protein
VSLIFYEYKHKCNASEKINGNNTFLPIAAGISSSVLSADSMKLGISQWLADCQIIFQHFPVAFLYPF